MDSRVRSILIVVGLGLLLYFVLGRRGEQPAPPGDRFLTPPTAAERGPEQTVPIRSGGLRARISTHSGVLQALRLDDRQYRDVYTNQPLNLSTTWREHSMPLRSDVAFERDGRNVMPAFLTFDIASRSPERVELVARPPGTDVEVRRAIRVHTEYAFLVNTSVINHGARGRIRFAQHVFHYATRNEESGGWFRQSW